MKHVADAGQRRLSVVAAPPRPTLEAVPCALLEALYEVCERGEDKALAQTAEASWALGQSVRSTCVQELHRLGVCHAGGVSTNAALRAKEHVLLGRLRELTAAEREWNAVAEAVAEADADKPIDELLQQLPTELEDEPQLASLPPLPNMEAQLEGLKVMASLCSDQVELTLKAMGRICAHSEAAQQSLAKVAHAEAFKGYLDVEQPRSLIRSLAAA